MTSDGMENLKDIVISPSHLPIFSMANAIHTTYNLAIGRLVNALNLGNFEPIDTFLYRVYVNDHLTGESCCITQKGGEKVTGLPFEVFISIMAMLNIKVYQATYAAGSADGGATVYISGEGYVSRIVDLFIQRPEFGLWDIMCKGGDEDA